LLLELLQDIAQFKIAKLAVKLETIVMNATLVFDFKTINALLAIQKTILEPTAILVTQLNVLHVPILGSGN